VGAEDPAERYRESKPRSDRAVGSTETTTTAELEFSAFFREQFPLSVRTIFLIVHDWEGAQDLAQYAFIECFSRWNHGTLKSA